MKGSISDKRQASVLISFVASLIFIWLVLRKPRSTDVVNLMLKPISILTSDTQALFIRCVPIPFGRIFFWLVQPIGPASYGTFMKKKLWILSRYNFFHLMSEFGYVWWSEWYRMVTSLFHTICLSWQRWTFRTLGLEENEHVRSFCQRISSWRVSVAFQNYGAFLQLS